MYVYIYMYMCVHMSVCVYICSYKRTYIHTCIYTYMQTFVSRFVISLMLEIVLGMWHATVVLVKEKCCIFHLFLCWQIEFMINKCIIDRLSTILSAPMKMLSSFIKSNAWFFFAIRWNIVVVEELCCRNSDMLFGNLVRLNYPLI